MKVKELIKYLEKLDQEKDIWVSYDCGYRYLVPVPVHLARECDEDDIGTKIEEEDYIIDACS